MDKYKWYIESGFCKCVKREVKVGELLVYCDKHKGQVKPVSILHKEGFSSMPTEPTPLKC